MTGLFDDVMFTYNGKKGRLNRDGNPMFMLSSQPKDISHQSPCLSQQVARLTLALRALVPDLADAFLAEAFAGAFLAVALALGAVAVPVAD